MVNVLKQEKQEQIRSLGRLGWSLRRIESETGVYRGTVARHLRAAGIKVRDPRQRRLRADSNAASGVTPDPGGNSNAASQVTPDLERGTESKLCQSACEPYREAIVQALSMGRNGKVIWQDLVTQHGFEHSYESVKRFTRKLQAKPTKEAHPTIQTKPGEECQVDYGTGPLVRHPKTGKHVGTRLFAMTLGLSRKSIWLLCFKSSSKIWCELHEEAFRRLGGVPRIVVLDNLKEGVIKPDFYDPEINQLYAKMLAHYGVVALPARVRHPDRKGKVESAIGHAQSTPLKGRRFDTLSDAQAYLDEWSSNWADTRIHGTMKRRVAAMFAEEKPSLGSLPIEPFRYFKYGVRIVHLDGCVEVDAAFYGTPRGWLGKQVAVQWDDVWIRIMHPSTGELLRELRKKPRGYRNVASEDKPAKTPPTTVNLLARANRAGAAIGSVCSEIHRRKKEGGVRQILGVLSLAKKNGPDFVNDACKAALEVGSPTYRFVRLWTERKPPVPIKLRHVDPLIRDLTLYRDIISQATQTETP